MNTNMPFGEFKNNYDYVWEHSIASNPNEEFEDTIQLYYSLGNTDKELSESALYVVWWFNVHGFRGEIVRNNTAKTEYSVCKDEVTDTFTLTATNQNPKKCDIKKYMNCYKKSFDMKCEIERLKKELANKTE